MAKAGKGVPGKFWKRFLNWIAGEATVNEAALEEDAKEMQRGLQKQRDAATQSMALAAAKKEELVRAVTQHDELKKTAKTFLARGEQDKAARVAQQLLDNEQRVDDLSTQYKSLKEAADNAIATFRSNAEEVQKRLKKVNELQELQRVNSLRREAQKAFDSFDLDSPMASFDKTADAINLKSQQLDAQAALGDTEGKKLDLEISQELHNDKIRDTLRALEFEMKDEAAEIFDEKKILGEGTVNKAKALLQEPTFKTLSAGAVSAAEKVPAQKRSDRPGDGDEQ